MSKLRFGVIGTARIAERRIIPAIQGSKNAHVTAVASRAGARARTFAERNNIPKAYTGYEALLTDPDIDAVYIPLPNALHCEWTVKAARAGKHVLCEKPFAANAREVDEMIAACEEHDVMLMEAFMYRFHPQTVKVKELVENGAIGALKMVRAAFCFTITQETNIRLSAALAGGCLMDAGTYCVNIARTMIGVEPQAVMALAHMGAASDVDETMSGVLEFPHGAFAAFECSFRTPYRAHVELIGERGRIELLSPFITNNKETMIVWHHADDRAQTFVFPAVDQYTLMAEHFAECVMDRLPLRYPPSEGRAQMRALDALYESVRTGKVIRV
jgi:D-xylose 1-dehydrogenase (NADP+, D-xylono-1,5-lactone-forming)